MARPLRIEYPGAWYHVTSRGNERREIFRDDKDRIRFLSTLKESIDQFNVEVHCYVLMSNHFHFLLRTPEGNLSSFMQRFNTAYTTYFNLRHQRAGHLYQGRFKAIIVEADEYLKGLSQYLHLNPVRLEQYKDLSIEEKAKILKEYRWSSLCGYLGLGKRDKFVKYAAILNYMGGDTKQGRKRYGNFVISGVNKALKNPIEEARAGVLLGTESFTEWIRETFIDGRKWSRREQPQVKSLMAATPLEEIARVVGEEYGVNPAEIMKLCSPHREARRVLIEISYRLNSGGRPIQNLGDELGGIGGAAVRNCHVRIQERIMKDPELATRVKRIYNRFVSKE
jgi:REP element-mobilizing transposase RayT